MEDNGPPKGVWVAAEDKGLLNLGEVTLLKLLSLLDLELRALETARLEVGGDESHECIDAAVEAAGTSHLVGRAIRGEINRGV